MGIFDSDLMGEWYGTGATAATCSTPTVTLDSIMDGMNRLREIAPKPSPLAMREPVVVVGAGREAMGEAARAACEEAATVTDKHKWRVAPVRPMEQLEPDTVYFVDVAPPPMQIFDPGWRTSPVPKLPPVPAKVRWRAKRAEKRARKFARLAVMAAPWMKLGRRRRKKLNRLSRHRFGVTFREWMDRRLMPEPMGILSATW